jgi:peroxiredoxin
MSQQWELGFVLLVSAVLLGIYIANGVHQPAPDFSLPGTYGGRFDLASYRGRSVLLVFWTTSCPICQRELPMLSKLEPEFRNKGVSVLAINIGGEAGAGNFMSSNSVNLTSLSDDDGAVSRAHRVGGVPKLVLVGGDGKIRHSTSGWTGQRVLREWMDSAGGS